MFWSAVEANGLEVIIWGEEAAAAAEAVLVGIVAECLTVGTSYITTFDWFEQISPI